MAEGLLYGRRQMMRSLFLLSLLTATVSAAQGVKLSYETVDVTTKRFNANDCNLNVTVNWTNTALGLGLCANTDLKVWASELECQDSAGTTDVVFNTISSSELSAGVGTFTVAVAELPGFKYSDAGVQCGTDGVERSHRLCGAYRINGTGIPGSACTVSQTNSLSLIYDTKAPVAPTITVDVQDSALLVKFKASPDTTVIHVYTREQGTAAFIEKAQLATASGSSIKVSGLTNDTTYDVMARSEDAAGNFSENSELFSATPRLTLGFYGRYRSAGGTDTATGCSAINGLPFLLACGLWLLRRKRNP